MIYNTVKQITIPQLKKNIKSGISYYNNKGYHIEENIFSKEECERAILESDQFENAINKNYQPELQPHKSNNYILKLMKKNNLTKLVKLFIANEKKIYGIQSTFFYGLPGTSGASMHQDGTYVQPEFPDSFISAWIPLVDVNIQKMGNLIILENSHKDGYFEVVKKNKNESNFQNSNLSKFESKIEGKIYNKKTLYVKQGSIVFLHPYLLHGSISNQSNLHRYTLLLTYIREGCSFREGREAKRTLTEL